MTFPPAAGAAPSIPLDRLPRNTAATIVEVARPTDDHDRSLALRMSEIGFVPGEQVRIVAHGFLGKEPLAVRIGRSTFALRSHEAALVRVRPNGDAP